MHILFLDESGTPPPPGKRRNRYFVIGGLAIPDGVWCKVRDELYGMKIRRGLYGELKWRYFAPNNDDEDNPMRTMNQAGRNEIRTELYQIICGTKSIRSLACVACIEAAYAMPSVNCADDLYHYAYKPLSKRFQYHLQDLSRTVGRVETGIIVADHRGPVPDSQFRGAHERLLKRTQNDFTSTYPNLVESLFFLPSDISVGIQLADMVAGAVWRKYEKNDDSWYKHLEPSVRKHPTTGKVDGYGIVKFPKGTWK
jgi:Protein of unknown function (DUF3800)